MKCFCVPRSVVALVIFAGVCHSFGIARAADWPTWRHDANRSATTDEELASKLHLQWTLRLPGLKPAWPEDPRLQFDANYEPVVVGTTMYVASSHNDTISALDTRSGKDKWRFFADGPVRFAPVVADGRLYFGADDGQFYCLDASSGEKLWSLSTAPAARRVLGNERLISVWPMRGGPVLSDGKIHFTVGVWPFEGVFLYTLDATTGAQIDRKAVTDHPEADIATIENRTPQGYLAASGSTLYIPCGRSEVARFDLSANKLVKPFGYRTGGTTSYHVSAIDRWLFHGGISFDVESKRALSVNATQPVFTESTMYVGNDGDVIAYDLQNPKLVETKDRRGREIKRTELAELWRLRNPRDRDVPKDKKKLAAWIAQHPIRIGLKAGGRLYGYQDNELFAVESPQADAKPAVGWRTTIEGSPRSLLAADGRLFAVTREGQIHCFGAEPVEPSVLTAQPAESLAVHDEWKDKVTAILQQPGANEGYGLVLGIGTGQLIDELVRQSDLRLIVVDPDEAKIESLRRRFDALDAYGTKIVAITGHALKLGLPRYLANLIVAEDVAASGFESTDDFARAAFETLRPYGGLACLEMSESGHDAFAKSVSGLELASAEVTRAGSLTMLTRSGALPGSADWTHEYGDPSNTLMSRDSLVKAPLGVQWFGGPASDGSLFYNRHFWGPSMAVVGGRMFIQGPGKLTAVDVYTGRILWQIPLEENDKINEGRRGNNFEKVIAGFHFLAVEDAIYLVDGRRGCLRFDPATGEQVSRFTLPSQDDEWGRIRVKGDLLIASIFRKVEGELKTKGHQQLPVELAVMDRHSGEIVWSKTAELSFPFVAISDDTIFCFDGAIEGLYRDWDRKGLLPKAAETRYVRAFDLNTGEQRWKYTTDVVVTWLGYSSKRDVLMVSNKMGMTAFRGKNGEELWKKYQEGHGFRGHPESLWDRIILWNDQIIDQRGPGRAYSLDTGDEIMRVNPLTGKPIAWEFTKSGHHCNYAIAAPHLMTFRADEAGFCDIATGNTSRLSGFRSGCRNSLIPANGVLNAPNFAHGCSCGYSVFTSLALTHLPESEMWSYSALKWDEKTDSVERVGVNFGAPGDRAAKDGTLWLDFPNVGGSSPAISVKTDPKELDWFHRHSSLVEGDGHTWVAASGFEGDASVTITLDTDNNQTRPYTVRLYFCEPRETESARRTFDVALQGKTVLEGFDVVLEAGGRNRGIVREFANVTASTDITVALKATSGRSVLSGIEIVAAQPESAK